MERRSISIITMLKKNLTCDLHIYDDDQNIIKDEFDFKHFFSRVLWNVYSVTSAIDCLFQI